MTQYKDWTLIRLFHYWYHQPQYEDREGIKQELINRGLGHYVRQEPQPQHDLQHCSNLHK
jgi:hypothetical protein